MATAARWRSTRPSHTLSSTRSKAPPTWRPARTVTASSPPPNSTCTCATPWKPHAVCCARTRKRRASGRCGNTTAGEYFQTPGREPGNAAGATHHARKQPVSRPGVVPGRGRRPLLRPSPTVLDNIEQVVRSRPLAVVCRPSGIGKTSLVLAGLLPRLRRPASAGSQADAPVWRIAVPLRPGIAPATRCGPRYSTQAPPVSGGETAGGCRRRASKRPSRPRCRVRWTVQAAGSPSSSTSLKTWSRVAPAKWSANVSSTLSPRSSSVDRAPSR